MNVGYFSVKHDSATDFIDWEKLKQQKVIRDMKYITHVEFEEPLSIVMDGKKRTSLITWNKNQAVE